MINYFKKKSIYNTVVLFIIISLLSSCSNKPKIHIDNYSGIDVKVYLDNNHWVDVPHSNRMDVNSIKNKAVKLEDGKYLVTIKNDSDQIFESFNITVEYGEYGNIYIMNIGNVISYEAGRAYYGNPHYPPSYPNIINQRFFKAGLESRYFFENLPERKSVKRPLTYDYFYYTNRLSINPNFFGTEEFLYQGNYKNGLKSGYGKLSLGDGWTNRDLIYEGYWENDLMSGDGKYYFLNGDTFNGEFSKGKFKSGTLSYDEYDKPNWSSGVSKWSESKYKGEFKNNKKNGIGKYWYPSGAVFEGFFDCCSDTKPFQTGILTLKSGKVEEGTWTFQ